MGLLNYTNAAGPGVPALLSSVGNRLIATPGGDPKPASAERNHTTVVEALTALGIPIPPTSRGTAPGMEDVNAQVRSGIQVAALTSPNSGVALDQLRRSMALRESSETSVVTSANTARIHHRIGNVSGTNFASGDRVVAPPSNSASSNHPMEPDPNVSRFRGSTCS